MDAVEFLREWNRICKAGGTGCFCDLNPASGGDYCDVYAMEHPGEAVAIVEKWAAEHPIKTRQSEFLKMFPKARMEGKTVDIDPCEVDVGMAMNCKGRLCGNCREEYWLEEVE